MRRVNHARVCEIHAPERVAHSPVRGGQTEERKAVTSRGETCEGGGEAHQWGEMTERDRSSLTKTRFGLQIIFETEDDKAMGEETESGINRDSSDDEAEQKNEVRRRDKKTEEKREETKGGRGGGMSSLALIAEQSHKEMGKIS